MTNVMSTAASASALSWDGEGRRVSGGALAPDLPAAPGEEVTFSDFLSVINPLQHIPVVSSIYRWVTGDTIKPAARVIGGALYGGPIGLATAAFNAIVEQVKGSDFGAQALALVTPDRQTQTVKAAPQEAVTEPAKGETSAPTPDADRMATNLAALQQLAADLKITAEESAEAKPAEPPAIAPLQPGQARSLAYYQANAGRRLATADTTRYALPQQKGSMPFAHAASSMPAAGSTEAADKRATPVVANESESPPAAWFSSAMMRGLDRYRTMQQLDKAAPQVDLSH
jgi:hypothetical protein